MLHTARLLIRPPLQRDYTAFKHLHSTHANHLSDWVAVDTTLNGFKSYLKKIKNAHTAGFFVFNQATETLLGVINFNSLHMQHPPVANLGYYMHSLHVRQGYAYEALSVLIPHMFNTCGLHHMEADIQPQNTASRALAQKLGFQRTLFMPRHLYINGQWQDHDRWVRYPDSR